MRIPELLVPASSLEVLKTAVIFGADAVYIGGEVFSLRAKSKNFSLEDMKEGIDFAHAHGVKAVSYTHLIWWMSLMNCLRRLLRREKRFSANKIARKA